MLTTCICFFWCHYKSLYSCFAIFLSTLLSVFKVLMSPLLHSVCIPLKQIIIIAIIIRIFIILCVLCILLSAEQPKLYTYCISGPSVLKNQTVSFQFQNGHLSSADYRCVTPQAAWELVSEWGLQMQRQNERRLKASSWEWYWVCYMKTFKGAEFS